MNANQLKQIKHYHCCDNLHECIQSKLKPIHFDKQQHYYFVKVGKLNPEAIFLKGKILVNFKLSLLLDFCPFCGQKLEMLQDLFFDLLEKNGYNFDEIADKIIESHRLQISEGKIPSNSFLPDIDKEFNKQIPEKFQSDVWWVEGRYSKYIPKDF